MKTLEQILDYESQCFDSRDLLRLVKYMTKEQAEERGFSSHEIAPLTREEVLKDLERDLLFGWEKAQNKRGLSAELMYRVVSMWNWVLEEGLEDFDDYAPYGEPLFKEVSEKYGIPLKEGTD